MTRTAKTASTSADIPDQRNPKPMFVADMTADHVSAKSEMSGNDGRPTSDDVTKELWSIATGEGSEASRVSALRALADIMGLLKQQQQEMPEAMAWLMDALAAGLSDQQDWADRVSTGKDL